MSRESVPGIDTAEKMSGRALFEEYYCTLRMIDARMTSPYALAQSKSHLLARLSNESDSSGGNDSRRSMLLITCFLPRDRPLLRAEE